MRSAFIAVLLAGSLGAASVARAQTAPPPPPQAPAAPAYAAPAAAQPPGFHTHDGFFLQLDLGFGGMGSKANDTIFGDVEYSGSAGEFSIAVGYAVLPNFILAGHLWGASMADPTFKVNGTEVGAADATLSLSGIGLNLTYYFMPINIYLSATPSIGTLSSESNGTTNETKSGFALRLAVGKEWWVSTNWGIGLNVQYAYGSNEADVSNPPTWTTNWFGVAFSATYN